MAPLKLGGRPLDLNPLPPSAVKLKAFLDKAPADELFTTADLAAKTRIPVLAQNPNLFKMLDAYRSKLGNRMLWGNPRAIAELKRQVAA